MEDANRRYYYTRRCCLGEFVSTPPCFVRSTCMTLTGHRFRSRFLQYTSQRASLLGILGLVWGTVTSPLIGRALFACDLPAILTSNVSKQPRGNPKNGKNGLPPRSFVWNPRMDAFAWPVLACLGLSRSSRILYLGTSSSQIALASILVTWACMSDLGKRSPCCRHWHLLE